MLRNCWTTLITTADYGPGVVCLAQSLLLVASSHRLRCFVTCDAAKQGIIEAAHVSPGHIPQNLDIVDLASTVAVVDQHFDKDSTQDHSCFIDAPRRALFSLGSPFIFLDADMIVVQNIDSLFGYLPPPPSDAAEVATPAANSDDGFIYAVPNYRNKKKCYSVGGNFNAGLMVVPNPTQKDYAAILHKLNAGYNDTEEKLLNEVFRNRYHALPFGFNCQKRSFAFSPDVWNEVLGSETGVRVVHYVGYKPWQPPRDMYRLDWEFAHVDARSETSLLLGCQQVCAPYKPVTDMWHAVRGSGTYDAETAASYLTRARAMGHVHGKYAVQVPVAVSKSDIAATTFQPGEVAGIANISRAGQPPCDSVDGGITKDCPTAVNADDHATKVGYDGSLST